MELLTPVVLIVNVLLTAAVIVLLVLFRRAPRHGSGGDEVLSAIDAVKRDVRDDLQVQRSELREQTSQGVQQLERRLVEVSTAQDEALGRDRLERQRAQHDQQVALTEALDGNARKIHELSERNVVKHDELQRLLRQDLETLRTGNEAALEKMRTGNEVTLEKLGTGTEAKLEKMRETVDEKLQGTLEKRFGDMSTLVSQRLEQVQKGLGELQRAMRQDLETLRTSNQGGLEKMRASNEAALEKMRTGNEAALEKMRTGNEAKLEKMRETVDEKLQGTLEKRLGESFALVSQRLEQVQKGLGEMQTLASDVGGLKRVLTNVKNRGSWGEVQLSRQLEDILAPTQYEQNVVIRPGTQESVEFAVKLPGRDDDAPVYLPIDSKFPQEDYERLLAAQEAADPGEIEATSKSLERAILTQAKKISEKYIAPPHSTDFAILYLPTEGLFAEVIRRPGLTSRLQSELRVLVTGPTTLMSLLNSLQMGFRTLAIEQRSSEVWQVLSAAKTEFGKYAQVWDKLGKQLGTAQRTVEEAGRRTRAVERKLRDVEATEDLESDTAIEASIAFALDESVDEPADETADDAAESALEST